MCLRGQYMRVCVWCGCGGLWIIEMKNETPRIIDCEALAGIS